MKTAIGHRHLKQLPLRDEPAGRRALGGTHNRSESTSHGLARRVHLGLAIAIGLSGGCSSDEDPVPTLPPETPSPTPTPTPLPVWDDGNPDGNLEPEHTLAKDEEGIWYLTPSGGPYEAMTGELLVTEHIDDSEDATCSIEFALTGSSRSESGALQGCEGCSFAFLITYALIAGDASTCLSTDIPEDGEQLILAWAPAESGQGALYLNYQNTGQWILWYEGYLSDDILSFSWSSTLGVILE